jgi:hypothetical protein
MEQQTSSSHSPRARRFLVRLPLQYRQTGTKEWLAGETENLSCSGVLFRCSGQLGAGAPVELTLPLPPEMSGGTDIQMHCSGRVARTTGAPNPGDSTGIAVAFEDLRLLPAARTQTAGVQPEEPGAKSSRGSGPAHQLNNQLTITIAYCDFLLERGGFDDQVRRGLQRIRESAQRIGALIREL